MNWTWINAKPRPRLHPDTDLNRPVVPKWPTHVDFLSCRGRWRPCDGARVGSNEDEDHFPTDKTGKQTHEKARCFSKSLCGRVHYRQEFCLALRHLKNNKVQEIQCRSSKILFLFIHSTWPSKLQVSEKVPFTSAVNRSAPGARAQDHSLLAAQKVEIDLRLVCQNFLDNNFVIWRHARVYFIHPHIQCLAKRKT